VRAVLSMLAVAVVLLSACAGDEVPTDLYEAVPEASWPVMEGVTVLKSEGYPGQECCESHPGGRNVVVAVAVSRNADALRSLRRSMTRAGWSPSRCANRAFPGRELCAKAPGLFAVLRPSKHSSGATVRVQITRSPV
jgi:hypothetical protein